MEIDENVDKVEIDYKDREEDVEDGGDIFGNEFDVDLSEGKFGYFDSEDENEEGVEDSDEEFKWREM